MNARTTRRTALVPLLTLGAGVLTALSLMLTAGADAAGTPTPSETTVVAIAAYVAPTGSDHVDSDDTMAPPTGTSPTSLRSDLGPPLVVEGIADRPVDD